MKKDNKFNLNPNSLASFIIYAGQLFVAIELGMSGTKKKPLTKKERKEKRKKHKEKLSKTQQ
jgi:hypothetical protein